MAKVTKKEFLPANIEKVWQVVTDNSQYYWRSDLDRIELIDDGKKFMEYTKDGFCTIFTITKKIEQKQYEFDMVNKNMSGHWIGTFREVNGGTEITFIEDVKANNLVINLFAGIYLKKQQKQYIEDLKKVLEG